MNPVKPMFLLMTMARAKQIINKSAKQLQRSAKILKTTPDELRADAVARIKYETVPKLERPTLNLFTMVKLPGGRERMMQTIDDAGRRF